MSESASLAQIILRTHERDASGYCTKCSEDDAAGFSVEFPCDAVKLARMVVKPAKQVFRTTVRAK